MTLTATEVRRILWEAGVPVANIALADRTYETVSKAGVRRIWSAWVDSLPDELTTRHPRYGLCPLWVEGNFDCDDHAHDFVGHCIKSNARTAVLRREKRGGILVGAHWYIAEPKPDNRREGGHAACWTINHQRNLSWFEPAEGRFIGMRQSEIGSIFEGLVASSRRPSPSAA